MSGDMNWLLIATAAILIVGALLGYINGLIKTILNLVIGIVTLVLVLFLSPQVCTFLQEKTELPAYVNQKVEAVVREQVGQLQMEQPGLVLEEGGGAALIERLPFLPALKDALTKNEALNSYAGQGVERLISYISEAISGQIIVLLAYFATFIIVFFALRIIVFLLNIIEHLPLVHGVNKLAGLLAGLAEGLVAVWILGIILSVIGTTPIGQSAAACIRESGFLQMLYGNNLLQQIIFWSVK